MSLRTGYLISTLILSLGISGCGAREPESVGITGIVYNYSDETIAFVSVNGKEIGRGIDEAKPGEVKGGSGMCCFRLDAAALKANVQVTMWDKSQYETTATIEKWWPDLAHYGVVHILPGRKVVMQVTPSAPRPRKDLLESQQIELGMEKKTLFNYWSAGPIERIDGKQ